jgi:hypothetical protein
VNVIYSTGKGIFNNQDASSKLREEEKNRLFQLVMVEALSLRMYSKADCQSAEVRLDYVKSVENYNACIWAKGQPGEGVTLNVLLSKD